MADPRKELGNKGEALVASYLEKDGFVIRHVNYRRRCGEIDVIAQKNELIVFVEVKARQTNYFSLSSVVNTEKQRKIIRTARIYSAEHHLDNHILRFDVALIEQESIKNGITYFPNAFTAPYV